jgi:hypothetical protein
MFHVERIKKMNYFSLKPLLVLIFFVVISCSTSRQSIQIPDYIIEPNGKEIIGKKSLSAFIFENNQKNLPLENFLSIKFNSDNIFQNEFWITIDKDKYKILIYDSAEFEKYFNSANYAMINQLPENAKKGDQRKFIAISMINAYNEDCLASGSLYCNQLLKKN